MRTNLCTSLEQRLMVSSEIVLHFGGWSNSTDGVVLTGATLTVKVADKKPR